MDGWLVRWFQRRIVTVVEWMDGVQLVSWMVSQLGGVWLVGYSVVDYFVGWFVEWLFGWLVGWMVGQLIGYSQMVGWLDGLLVGQLVG